MMSLQTRRRMTSLARRWQWWSYKHDVGGDDVTGMTLALMTLPVRRRQCRRRRRQAVLHAGSVQSLNKQKCALKRRFYQSTFSLWIISFAVCLNPTAKESIQQQCTFACKMGAILLLGLLLTIMRKLFFYYCYLVQIVHTNRKYEYACVFTVNSCCHCALPTAGIFRDG